MRHLWSHENNLLLPLILQVMEVRGPYVTNIGSGSGSSVTVHIVPLAEFVEVVLLPLDEFQTKIDGESLSRCHVRPRHNRADTFPFVFSDLLKKEKILVDAKVYIFGMGMAQAFFKPKEVPVLKQ